MKDVIVEMEADINHSLYSGRHHVSIDPIFSHQKFLLKICEMVNSNNLHHITLAYLWCVYTRCNFSVVIYTCVHIFKKKEMNG